MIPRKILLLSQKLFIHCVSRTHNRINLSSDPCLVLFQCRLHVNYPEEKELFLACLHAILQRPPSNPVATAHSCCFCLFSFHFYSVSGHYKTYSFSFRSWTTVNVMKSWITYKAFLRNHQPSTIYYRLPRFSSTAQSKCSGWRKLHSLDLPICAALWQIDFHYQL